MAAMGFFLAATSTSTSTPTCTAAATMAATRSITRIACSAPVGGAVRSQLRCASSSSSSRPPPTPQPSSAPAPPPPAAAAEEPPAKPSFFTSTSKLAEQAAAKPLPYLGTAPGYPFPPRVVANEPSPPPAPSVPKPAAATTPAGAAPTGATTPASKPAAKAASKAAAANLRDARIYHERKAIVAEATKGYFHDFHNLRAHGGKTWRAPASLIREERAQWWPDWVGKRLSDGRSVSTAEALRGRVSVVSVLGSKASEEHARSFVAPALAAYGADGRFQSVRINVQLSALRALLLRLVFNSLRATVPDEKEQAGYFLCTAAPEVPDRALELELEAAKRAAGRPSTDSSTSTAAAAAPSTDNKTTPGSSTSPGAEAYLRSALCLHNKHVGYVFLVDQRCRIRWAGCAYAEEAEREALRACVGVLLSRR